MGNNWVQTHENQGWFVIFRLYNRLEPWSNETWRRGKSNFNRVKW
jgi:hypothetical protein